MNWLTTLNDFLIKYKDDRRAFRASVHALMVEHSEKTDHDTITTLEDSGFVAALCCLGLTVPLQEKDGSGTWKALVNCSDGDVFIQVNPDYESVTTDDLDRLCASIRRLSLDKTVYVLPGGKVPFYVSPNGYRVTNYFLASTDQWKTLPEIYSSYLNKNPNTAVIEAIHKKMFDYQPIKSFTDSREW